MKATGLIGRIYVTYPKISAIVSLLALNGVYEVFIGPRRAQAFIFDPWSLVGAVAFAAIVVAYLFKNHREWFKD